VELVVPRRPGLRVVDGLADAGGEAVRLADGADADLVVVDLLAVGELVELLLDEVEQRLPLVGRALEVLHREGVQRQLLDVEVATPPEHRLGRLRAGAVALRPLFALLPGVPAVAVLDDGDVRRGPRYFPLQEPLVDLECNPTKPREHIPSHTADSHQSCDFPDGGVPSRDGRGPMPFYTGSASVGV